MNQQRLPLDNATARIDGPYRYSLTRTWNDRLAAVAYLMLNPSTADADHDDPTLRRCIHFAREGGYGGLHVVNLFAWRASDPSDLIQEAKSGVDIVGPGNNDAILEACIATVAVVCAWGALGGIFKHRTKEVLGLLDAGGYRLLCLGQANNGQPRHPLYLENSTHIRPYNFQQTKTNQGGQNA